MLQASDRKISDFINSDDFRREIDSLNLSEKQMERLSLAKREDILSSIAVANSTGFLSPAQNDCLVKATLCFYGSNQIFDLEKWTSLYFTYLSQQKAPYMPNLDSSGKRFLPLIAFGAGLALGWYIGEATA